MNSEEVAKMFFVTVQRKVLSSVISNPPELP